VINQVQFFSGATQVGTGTLSSGTNVSGTWTSNGWTNVAAGTYSITVKATDANNVTTTSAPVTVTVNPAQGNTTGMFFISADHLGTPRLVQNQGQQAVWAWEQAEPFGDSSPNENPSGIGNFSFSLRFPGQYVDSETGVTHNASREYIPSIGRYMQMDPEGIDATANVYSYVDNIPLTYWDSTGRSKVTGQGSIGGNDPAVSGISKNSTPQQIQNAIKEAQKIVDDPKTSPARKKFLKGWIKVAKRGFTKAFCPPFLDDVAKALAREQCKRGDMASCKIFEDLGGEIIDPNGAPAIPPDEKGMLWG